MRKPKFCALGMAISGMLMLDIPSAGADERDAIIQDLQRRVEALEQQLKGRDASSPPAPASASADDEESARALERTLTRQGGLVLPTGKYELEPRVEYSYRGTEGLAIVDVAGQAQVTNEVVRRNRFEPSLGLRLGLPRASQAEIRVPYAVVREDRATTGTLRETNERNGVGDIELAYTKQLRTEQGGRTGLLGSLLWTMPTGDFSLRGPSAGSGFHSVQLGLTAVQRQDPLVFFGTLSHTWVFERSHEGTDVDPGNPVGLRAGAILAASPQTSLRGGFEVSRAGLTRINNAKVPGTDTVSGMLQFGVATLLSPRALLDIQLGIGVTREAPDFRITAAVPIRFD